MTRTTLRDNSKTRVDGDDAGYKAFVSRLLIERHTSLDNSKKRAGAGAATRPRRGVRA
jgi:hypothetical protein